MDNVARAQGGVPIALLHESPVLTPLHYRVVALCFLAWIFDFFDLVLYSFLLVGIARELHLSPTDSSLVLGFSFLMTAIGGVSFGQKYKIDLWALAAEFAHRSPDQAMRASLKLIEP